MSDILDKYMQADGMEDKKPENKPTTLEQIWGNDGLSKYGTFDVEVYRKQLVAMNKSDLHVEANKRGLIPIEDSMKLRERLIREFKIYVGQLTKPVRAHKQKPMSPEAIKILSEGR